MQLFRHISSYAVVQFAFQLHAYPAGSTYTNFRVVLVIELPLPTISGKNSYMCAAQVNYFPVVCRLTSPYRPAAKELVTTDRRTMEDMVPVFLNRYGNFIRRMFIGQLSIARSQAIIQPTQSFQLRVRASRVNDSRDYFQQAREIRTRIVRTVIAAGTRRPFPEDCVRQHVTYR